MQFEAINFSEKLSKFSEHWKPKIIAQMNDYHFKVVKLQGEFVWHKHDDTDEVFIVLERVKTSCFALRGTEIGRTSSRERGTEARSGKEQSRNTSRR